LEVTAVWVQHLPSRGLDVSSGPRFDHQALHEQCGRHRFLGLSEGGRRGSQLGRHPESI